VIIPKAASSARYEHYSIKNDLRNRQPFGVNKDLLRYLRTISWLTTYMIVMDEIHMGQLLERAIRKTGFRITEIAAALGISRRTIYNWFKLEVIDESIMGRISDVIRHDFSSGKPNAMISLRNADSSPLKDDAYWKDKYKNLLERYSNLIKEQ
jgi:hypothetical protein